MCFWVGAGRHFGGEQKAFGSLQTPAAFSHPQRKTLRLPSSPCASQSQTGIAALRRSTGTASLITPPARQRLGRETHAESFFFCVTFQSIEPKWFLYWNDLEGNDKQKVAKWFQHEFPPCHQLSLSGVSSGNDFAFLPKPSHCPWQEAILFNEDSHTSAQRCQVNYSWASLSPKPSSCSISL